MEDDVREVRIRCTRHLADLHRLHLTLLGETRWLKRFTTEGRASVEIEIVAELMEQYLSASDAFLENMRGRMEARLGVLRRGEPVVNGRPDEAPGHGGFWLGFSRLCAVLRRAARRAET